MRTASGTRGGLSAESAGSTAEAERQARGKAAAEHAEIQRLAEERIAAIKAEAEQQKRQLPDIAAAAEPPAGQAVGPDRGQVRHAAQPEQRAEWYGDIPVHARMKSNISAPGESALWRRVHGFSLFWVERHELVNSITAVPPGIRLQRRSVTAESILSGGGNPVAALYECRWGIRRSRNAAPAK